MFAELGLEPAFDLLGKNGPARIEKARDSSGSKVKGRSFTSRNGGRAGETCELSKCCVATNEAERNKQCWEKRNFIQQSTGISYKNHFLAFISELLSGLSDRGFWDSAFLDRCQFNKSTKTEKNQSFNNLIN